jgi:hypothetical protein
MYNDAGGVSLDSHQESLAILEAARAALKKKEQEQAQAQLQAQAQAQLEVVRAALNEQEYHHPTPAATTTTTTASSSSTAYLRATDVRPSAYGRCLQHQVNMKRAGRWLPYL